MPEQTSFAVLYKKLLDSNFDPGPERAQAALNSVLRRLSQGPPPKARNPESKPRQRRT